MLARIENLLKMCRWNDFLQSVSFDYIFSKKCFRKKFEISFCSNFPENRLKSSHSDFLNVFSKGFIRGLCLTVGSHANCVATQRYVGIFIILLNNEKSEPNLFLNQIK